MKKIVIALGGNALEDSNKPTAENQLHVIKQNVVYIANLVEQGHRITITHGNGPQVGRIALQNEAGKDITPILPFDVCGAMSQGMIGYHIQQALQEELLSRGLQQGVVSLVTQVLVDKNDTAFNNPTKPIGPFYTKEEADILLKTKEYIVKEDSGRGYRRVIASPQPIKIIELHAIKKLVENNFIVITVGGGGIPVIRKTSNKLEGIPAVIDKDFASAKLAQELESDLLVILTGVDQVALNFNQPNQKLLNKVSLTELKQYVQEGHFGAGSMLPKIQASIGFVESKDGREALITSLDKVSEALKGNNGTLISVRG